MIRTPIFWFFLLSTLCIVAPYLLGIPPRRRRDWVLLTATIAFLAWLLGGFASVRTATLVFTATVLPVSFGIPSSLQ